MENILQNGALSEGWGEGKTGKVCKEWVASVEGISTKLIAKEKRS